jgi:hypothetical protein
MLTALFIAMETDSDFGDRVPSGMLKYMMTMGDTIISIQSG